MPSFLHHHIALRGLGSLVAFACLYGAACQASAHGGGLNGDGCHNNRKTGDYHCHRPAARPQPAALPASLAVAGPDAIARTPAMAPSAGGTRPQCFTGPRGGTYTITASGRKNYSGC